MTAEDNGVPEDDDPFAYLYRGQEGDDARNVAPQPGVPRTSYQQATQVGRTQYGQPRPQSGQPPVPQYQQQYQQQVPQQQAPQTTQLPPAGGGRSGGQGGGQGRSSSSGGGSNRAVTFGAVGVVLAVAIGIGVAVLNSGGGKSPVASPSTSSVASAGASSTGSTSPSASPSAALPGATNVSGMTLGGSAVPASNHTGSASTDGKFVPLTAAGMSVTWNNVTVPTAGSYTFWVHYANAGGGSDNNFTLTVNGKALPNSINLKNWSGITDWDKAWQRSYSPVTLNAGSNTIEVSYGSGSNAGVNVDQFAVTVSDNTPPWS